ncbi:MAG: ABC transporter ATP-binding protein, partial [Burkholderiales bacterium]
MHILEQRSSRTLNQETLITVEHLGRDYARHRAVDDVSFKVRRGEVLGFLGPNGAGKTTTMHIICGVLAPSAGRVIIAGHDIIEFPEEAKAHIGYLPEQPPLYFDLTVDQYLHYCACLRRMPRPQRSGAVVNSKARCGLDAVGHRLIGNLSKGFQQRVGIAQAIVHSPALVILDEPTVGLDPHQIVEIRELITELGADHSVILSTHILSEVQAICDRVLIIHQGRLILDEAIDALRAGGALNFTIALRRPPVPE